MKEQLQTIATLFALINPMVCVVLFSDLTHGRTPAQRRGDATKAVLTIGFILIIAAFLGARVLHLFGISFDVFSVAGGIVLAFIGFSMLAGTNTGSQASAPNSDAPQLTPSLGRLILFAASPGTITGVITSATTHSKLNIPVTTIVAIVAILTVTWILLLLASRKSSDNAAEPSLTHDMVSRYMGLIVVAMGIQFALTGYKAFMGG
jgi:MarC family membrane protein